MEEIRTLKKAWRVWHEAMIDRHNPDKYQSIEDISVVYAQVASQARVDGGEAKDWEKESGDLPHYLELKVKRAKSQDKVMFEGNIITRYDAEARIKYRDVILVRKNKVEDLPNATLFVIQNGFVGNDLYMWQSGGGYTTNVEKVQKFTKQEILKDHLSIRSQEKIWEYSHILTAVRRVVESQSLNHQYSIS